MDPSTPAKAVKKAVKSTVEGAAARVAEKLAEQDRPAMPGSPGSGTPTVVEPTKPREPLPPKPDQAGPERRTATGAATDVDAEAVSGQGRFLTTSQGARLRDSDHSLKAGRAGTDAAAGPPPAREDHPLRPRADPGAGRARAGRGRPRRVRGLRQRAAGDERGLPGQERRDPGVRPVLHGAGLARVCGHRARHPRLRHEVLHLRGHLRPGRQQHPGLLHPGRHQVPRRHPRGQAAPGPRDPAGAERARHVLGLRVPAHRGPAPHALEHVRPRHPALVPDDGGLRRPHLPLRQRRG